jgi:hypothetical protein
MNKNIIAFSVFSKKIRYWQLIKENISLAKTLYPDFICRFYIEEKSLINYEHYIQTNDQIEIILMPESNGVQGTFWRFLGCVDNSVDIFLSRDIDSLLNIKESLAVKEWLESDKDFHIMRDHKRHHNKPIMGGMWGCRNGLMKKIGFGELLNNCKKTNDYGDDQNFLAEQVYPLVYPYAFEHGPKNTTFKNTTHNFPACDYTSFIGKAIKCKR